MLRRSLERLTARLCLAAALLMGIAPGRELVLCVGPEGTVSLELASGEARCEGCPELAGGEHERQIPPAARERPDCPCRDIPVVPGGDEARVKPTRIIPGQVLASVPVLFGAARVVLFGSAPVAARSEAGFDPGLKHLRSVVLRV